MATPSWEWEGGWVLVLARSPVPGAEGRAEAAARAKSDFAA